MPMPVLSRNALWRTLTVMRLAVAAVVAVLALWGTWVSAGLGGLLLLLAAVGLALAWSYRPPVLRRREHLARLAKLGGPTRPRRPVEAVALSALLTFCLWNGVSAAWYVTHRYQGDPFQQRLAGWGRDHGYGPFIDWMEARTYNEPPSEQPADTLSLGVSAATTTVQQAPSGVDTTAAGETTTTVDPGPQPPEPITPLFAPALAGEGQWTPIAFAGGFPALWATSIRPLREAGGAVGSLVVIDQTHLRAGMFNGQEEPGGDWARDDRVPPELYPALVAAMNGGFRFEHIKGGYVTEGKVVKPLKDGDATLAVGEDGKLVLGKLGRDLFDDGSWVSIRQNLTLMVDGGTSWVQWGRENGTFWGANYGKDVYVNRSGACELYDGRLMYLMVGPVSAEQFADSMINVGCEKGIQLDINGTWPNFFTFQKNADGSVLPIFLDRRMGSNTYRYINGSAKEFFAFFDTALVPAQSVLDI